MAISLAACSGSSGSDGAAGADGTIAVPDADSDLAITVTQKDLDVLGTLDIDMIFNISGTDNLSADNRMRYYLYQGTSASTKTELVGVTGHLADTDTSNDDQAFTTSVLDTRLKTVDNYTLDTGLAANQEIANKDISHFILCPGNEGGDATSCASAEISDRFVHAASGTNITFSGFNATGASIAYGNSKFVVLLDNSSSLDNGTVSFTIEVIMQQKLRDMLETP